MVIFRLIAVIFRLIGLYSRIIGVIFLFIGVILRNNQNSGLPKLLHWSLALRLDQNSTIVSAAEQSMHSAQTNIFAKGVNLRGFNVYGMRGGGDIIIVCQR